MENTIGNIVDFRKAFWEKAEKERGIDGFNTAMADLSALDTVHTSSVVDDSVMESIIRRFAPRLDYQYYIHNDPSERSILEYSFGVYDVQFIEWDCGYYMTVVAVGEDGRKYCRVAFVDLFHGDFVMVDDYAKKPEYIGQALELNAKSRKFRKEHGLDS
jgi:hypothetical protein